MDIEYHFYITYIISLRSGFDREAAYKIAYSSQYTDDNKKAYTINEGEKGEYKNYISQTINILKPKDELLRIYPFFHFFPGSDQEILKASPRKDGKLHLLCTVPGNSNAVMFLEDALRSGDLYRVGIATHMFADTYAHQNFTGVKEKFNAMERIDQALNFLDIGHSDAKHDPDLPGLIWDDNRLTTKEKKIDNKTRFLSASGHIFDIFSKRQFKGISSQKIQNGKDILIKDIDAAIGKVSKTDGDGEDKRKKRYLKLLDANLVNDYNERAWFKDAVKGTLKETDQIGVDQRPISKLFYEWNENYKNSDWYGFQEAVKAHQEKAKEILRPTFERMEIEQVQNW